MTTTTHYIAWHDDQYLFRLTSTFGWDDAIALCNHLVKGIENSAPVSTDFDSAVGTNIAAYETIDKQISSSSNEIRFDGSQRRHYFNDSLEENYDETNEKNFQDWISHAITQLTYQDQWGNTPLHAASYVKPPVEVVVALFAVGRVLVKWKLIAAVRFAKNSPFFKSLYSLMEPLWAIPSKDGSTSFLVACCTGASTAVLQRYLDEVEYYIAQKWVADPVKARLLVLQRDDSKLLCNSPIKGWMDFHHRWISRQLGRMDSDTTIMGNRRNGTQSMINYIIQRGGGTGNGHIPRHVREEALLSLTDYWRLACRMLLFSTRHIFTHESDEVITQSITSPARISTNTTTLIHRCAAIAPYCPLALLEWMATKYYYLMPRGNDGCGVDRGCHEWSATEMCASMIDREGRLPLHLAIEASYIEYNQEPEKADDRTNGGANETIDAEHIHESFEKNGNSTIQRSQNTIFLSNGGEVITRSEKAFPKQIVEDIARWYPESKKIVDGFTFGSNARMPPALVTGTTSISKQSTKYYWNAAMEKNRFDIAKKLLQWYPNAAVTSFPTTGRSPLCQAIANGSHWHKLGILLHRPFHNKAMEEDEAVMGLVQMLWKYGPEMTSKKDPITGLFPFMLAATTAPTTSEYGLDYPIVSHDCMVVDTTFNLLRKDPQLVGSTAS
ncbi:hypothetical protein ACHAXS_010259 [Conticribra weissflogii]